ncbi:hypothetical protein M3J09_011462 [Ascochyta lentis]
MSSRSWRLQHLESLLGSRRCECCCPRRLLRQTLHTSTLSVKDHDHRFESPPASSIRLFNGSQRLYS